MPNLNNHSRMNHYHNNVYERTCVSTLFIYQKKTCSASQCKIQWRLCTQHRVHPVECFKVLTCICRRASSSWKCLLADPDPIRLQHLCPFAYHIKANRIQALWGPILLYKWTLIATCSNTKYLLCTPPVLHLLVSSIGNCLLTYNTRQHCTSI